MTTALVAVAGTAFADPPTPSAASTLQVGVPYTGTFTSDKDDGSRGWMRLPVLHRKDTIQFAVSNDAHGSFSICLTGPVDDFGADAAYDACTFEHSLSGGRKGRFRSTYTRGDRAGIPGHLLRVARHLHGSARERDYLGWRRLGSAPVGYP